MAKTSSTMSNLGTLAPKFSLLDVTTGSTVSLNYDKAPATVVMFICNHCPYVKHVSKALTILANDYIKKGVNFYAINSNEYENYPEDSPQNMKILAKQENYPFPYLIDETQEVAHAYDAVCTPDFFVYNSDYKLAYRGQLDDSRPGSDIEVTGNSIRLALDCILESKVLSIEQVPSIGCGIKWK